MMAKMYKRHDSRLNTSNSLGVIKSHIKTIIFVYLSAQYYKLHINYLSKEHELNRKVNKTPKTAQLEQCNQMMHCNMCGNKYKRV